MSFASPTALLALLAVPLLGALWALERGRRRRFAVRHPAASALAPAVRSVAARRRLLAPALLMASLALLALAFAKPERTVAVPIEKASVMLVTDESGSMLAGDVSPSRLDAAKNAA